MKEVDTFTPIGEILKKFDIPWHVFETLNEVIHKYLKNIIFSNAPNYYRLQGPVIRKAKI